VTGPSADFWATLPRKRVAAAVLFTDGDGRVLLVEPTYKEHWEVPGGSVEVDEAPYAAAVREVKEELGLSIAPGRLLIIDWAPPLPGRPDGIMLLFDGGVLGPDATADIRLPPDELRSWAWCTPAETSHRASDLLARRIAASIWALDGGETVYLENGDPIR
jgi:8-oxo-dGTP pyrophosphatase MutT (NUDIX family)